MRRNGRQAGLWGSTGRVESENRRFIQFPHPGREHAPDSGDWKRWNPTTQSHARKFLQVGGAWLDSGGLREGDLWAWAEWEPESLLLRRFDVPGTGKPGYLWKPVWSPKQSYRGLHNTDPFVFDGFYYINCKQTLEGLRRLGRGSLIVFGSKKGPHWVVDTVFVVADYVDHTLQDYERLLQGLVPECYWDVTLGPTYKGASASSAGVRRFYRGATYDAPVDGMFSFFPCLPAAQDTPFARPRIELPREYFTQTLAQGARGHALRAEPLAESTVKGLWHSIAAQVQRQGLLLCVYAESPARGTPA